MNFQILPNWCKKLGVLLYVVGTIPSGTNGFVRGYNDAICDCDSQIDSFLGLSNTTEWFFDLLIYAGMIMYFLSKEKIEDDYINKLRLDSYQLTVIIGLGIAFLSFLFSGNLNVKNSLFLEGFLMIYLITFWYKKRANLK